MDAKMACLIVLLFYYSSSQSYASFPKIKYFRVNDFNALDKREKSPGSNETLETGDHLSIKKSMVYHNKTLKLIPKTDAIEKNADDNFREKMEFENKRDKRDERDVSGINAPVQNISNTAKPPAINTRIPVYSQEFLRCGKIPVPTGHYTKFENGTVYVPFFERYFSEENYIIEDHQELLICPDFFPKHNDGEGSENLALESSRMLQTASLVCSCLSTGFIALFIVMFLVDKDLRTLPGSCVLSLCVALLLAYTCTFVQYYIEDRTGCTVVGMFMYYFFLSSFFWMNVMAYDIWRSVRRSVVQLRLCAGRSIKRQLSIYSLYAWGTPLAIAVASVLVHFATGNARFRLTFHLEDCWFARPEALWLYFAGPVLVLLGLNFLCFAVVFRMLQRASKSEVRCSLRGNRTDLKSRFVLCLKLNSVMGLTWLFGVVAELAGQEWLRYPYVVLGALQGLFIFLSYAINAKTKRIAQGFFRRNRFSFPSGSDQTKTTRL